MSNNEKPYKDILDFVGQKPTMEYSVFFPSDESEYEGFMDELLSEGVTISDIKPLPVNLSPLMLTEIIEVILSEYPNLGGDFSDTEYHLGYKPFLSRE